MTARQYFETDGDLLTFSHSGTLDDTYGLGHIDMCVFDTALDVRRLTVWPRQVRENEGGISTWLGIEECLY